jgi:hypothetical protein
MIADPSPQILTFLNPALEINSSLNAISEACMHNMLMNDLPSSDVAGLSTGNHHHDNVINCFSSGICLVQDAVVDEKTTVTWRHRCSSVLEDPFAISVRPVVQDLSKI